MSNISPAFIVQAGFGESLLHAAERAVSLKLNAPTARIFLEFNTRITEVAESERAIEVAGQIEYQQDSEARVRRMESVLQEVADKAKDGALIDRAVDALTPADMTPRSGRRTS